MFPAAPLSVPDLQHARGHEHHCQRDIGGSGGGLTETWAADSDPFRQRHLLRPDRRQCRRRGLQQYKHSSRGKRQHHGQFRRRRDRRLQHDRRLGWAISPPVAQHSGIDRQRHGNREHGRLPSGHQGPAAAQETFSGILTPATGANYLLGGGAPLTVATNLAGTSGLTAFGGGTGGMLILAGSNSYTGPHNDQQQRNAGICRRLSQTLNGGLFGSGSLIQEGPGTLTLGGAGTFSGVTTIAAGTLALANSAAYPGQHFQHQRQRRLAQAH